MWIVRFIASVLLATSVRGQLTCGTSEANCIATELNLTLSNWASISASETCGLPPPQGQGPEMFEFGGLTTVSEPDPAGPFPCDATTNRHTVDFIVDMNNDTWWQGPFLSGNVTVTLSFPNPIFFVLTELEFRSVRPARMRLDYSTDNGTTWTPYQYYSEDCDRFPIDQSTGWNLPRTLITNFPSNTEAVCIEDQSRPSPENRGTVTFSPFPRLGNDVYTNVSLIQNYLLLTNLRVELSALYSVFGVPERRTDPTANRYYYGLYRWTVRARCHCFGHSITCNPANGADVTGTVNTGCDCQHNTTGRHCEQCLPLFNNRPWMPGTPTNANECQMCQCNNHADSCTYSAAQGFGVCNNCRDNTEGFMCERCQPGFYRAPGTSISDPGACIPCDCDTRGTVPPTSTCDVNTGQCTCKTNVNGRSCNMCNDTFFGLSQANVDGCSPCNCHVNGSSSPVCNKASGDCTCKANVVSSGTPGRCDQCRAGAFGLSGRAPQGCWECVCSGQTATCTQAQDYQLDVFSFRTVFTPASTSGWTAIDLSLPAPSTVTTNSVTDVTAGIGQALSAFFSAVTADAYFVAPALFRGDHRLSLGHLVQYQIRTSYTGAPGVPLTTVQRAEGDLQIIGPNGLSLYINDAATIPLDTYRTVQFRLYTGQGWRTNQNQAATLRDIVQVLSDIQGVQIRGRYFTGQTETRVANVVLQTASLTTASNRDAVTSVEMCDCPAAYTTRDCSRCATPTFSRNTDLGNTAIGGAFRTCTACACNSHATNCAEETGICTNCIHNTEGNHCERCTLGFFGVATTGTANDCSPCPCPLTTPPNQFTQNCTVGGGISGSMCINCPNGHTGLNCETCADGFSGTPTVQGSGQCRSCECNCNIDQNTMGNCNTTTGQCLQCTRNTEGDQCERCLPGFFGVATNGCSMPNVEICQNCNCDVCGTTLNGVCDRDTGNCPCAANVVGMRCDRCAPDHYGRCRFGNGQGCRPCDCNLVGSVNSTCDEIDGQCRCHPNVINRECNECRNQTYNIASGQGCEECGCNVAGTVASACSGADCTCDKVSGQCPCRDNVVGRQCTTCRFGTFGTPPNCVVCHECFLQWFNIIQQLSNLVEIEDNRTTDALQRAFGGLTPEQITNLLQQIREKLNAATTNLTFRGDGATEQSLNALNVIFSQQQTLFTTLVTQWDRALQALLDLERRLPNITRFNGTVVDENGNIITAASLSATRVMLTVQVAQLTNLSNIEEAALNASRSRAQAASDSADNSRMIVSAAEATARTANNTAADAEAYSANASALLTENQGEIGRLRSQVEQQEAAAQNASRLLQQAQGILMAANTTAEQARAEAEQRLAEVRSLMANVTAILNQVATANASSVTAYSAVDAILRNAQELEQTANNTIQQTERITAQVTATVSDLTEAERLAGLVLNLTLPSRTSVRTLAQQVNSTILSQAEVDTVLQDAMNSLARAEETRRLAQTANNASQQALSLVVEIQTDLQVVDSNTVTIMGNLNRVRMYIQRVNASVDEVNRLSGEITNAAARLSSEIATGHQELTRVETCQNTTTDILARAEALAVTTCTTTAPQASANVSSAAQAVNGAFTSANTRLAAVQTSFQEVVTTNGTANVLASQLASTTDLAALQTLLQQYLQLQMDIQSANTQVGTQERLLQQLVADLDTLASRCV